MLIYKEDWVCGECGDNAARTGYRDEERGYVSLRCASCGAFAGHIPINKFDKGEF